jgi:hypothetical protein
VGVKSAWPLLGFVGFQKSEQLHATERGLFSFLGHPQVDVFGTDEVTLSLFYKVIGSWVFYFPKNPYYCRDARYLAPWWVFPAGCQSMVLRHFNSALQARKQVCSYVSLVHEVLKRFDLASWCFGMVLRNLTAYQMMRLRWGASQVPAKRAEQAFPLPNLGAQISHWTFPAPQDLLSSIQTKESLGIYMMGVDR